MGLKSADFALTDAQIDKINAYFASQIAAYIAEGEDVGMNSIKVEFEWVPGLGRFVTAHYDGSVKGFEIDSEQPDQINPTADNSRLA